MRNQIKYKASFKTHRQRKKETKVEVEKCCTHFYSERNSCTHFIDIIQLKNKMSGFKIDVFNGVYEINIDTFKNLNNMKSCISLDTLILNPDHKMNSIHFI
jgi:hypothetical protein